MSVVLLLGIVAWAAIAFMKSQRDAEIRKADPAAWVELQKIEHEKRRMRHEGAKKAAGLGVMIARILVKK